MAEQRIYSRWEYRMKKGQSTSDIFNEYKDLSENDERGVQVKGISAAIRVYDNVVILLTYDKDADLVVKLKLAGTPIISYKRLIKE